MPRAIWNGSISFGLVTIPVKMYNAVSRRSVSFNQLDDRTMSRIKYKKVSASDGSEVPSENIVRRFEYAKGQYILVSDEEIQSIAPKAGRAIDIEAFVDIGEIDPMSFDGSYHLAPAEGFEKAYRLLSDAMADEGKVAVARFVRSNKQLIGSLEREFAPADYHGTHSDELVSFLERKASGEEVITSTPEVDDGKVVDLLAALEASVAAAKQSRGGAATKSAKKKAASRKKVPSKKKAAAKKAAAKKTPAARRKSA